MYVCMYVYVCVCVRARVRVRACVCASEKMATVFKFLPDHKISLFTTSSALMDHPQVVFCLFNIYIVSSLFSQFVTSFFWSLYFF